MTKQEEDKKWWNGNNFKHANFAVIGKRERKEAALEVKANTKWRGKR